MNDHCVSRVLATWAVPDVPPRPGRSSRRTRWRCWPSPRCITSSIPGPRRAVPGGGPRGRRAAGGSRATRPIRAGRGEPRSRGNVAAAGVRCEPGGDAARRAGEGGGGRGPDADHSASAAAGPAAPGPELPLPGLPRPSRRGASVAALGAGRADDAVEPGVTLPPPSPGGARGGLPLPAAVPADPVGALQEQHPHRGSGSMRGRHALGGWGSGWTWAGRSACYIRWLCDRPERAGRQAARALEKILRLLGSK
jgi:hypothetical protein